ncbi:hypothetical protein [Aequorivita marina]|uniref:hypothetical protein n=1 Tax=Aequorivita marina TaxID=3073654 RepID=UPI002876597C|nr:hypothetical protein [Aequorivita sp. S2608]MDS1298560.1 hypothetical protein [Aequorivita sp. S2608]
MKYYYVLLLFFCISNSFSQDIIITNDGELIQSKVVKITTESVEYNKYNNLNGPLYVLPVDAIERINFENGTVESFTANDVDEKISIEDLKELIIDSIDKHAFTKSGKYNYSAEFNGNDIKLIPQKVRTNEVGEYKLYELSGVCNFHDISYRKDDVSYINIIINEYNNRYLEGDTLSRFSRQTEKERMKLVILVKGHDEAKVIYDALKKYNQYFKES